VVGVPLSRSVADHVADPLHAAPLDGADAIGEASGGERLLVRVGLWAEGARVVRARYRATTCASLIAYAEVACALVETGTDPGAITSGTLRALVPGVHPVHHDRADLVAKAIGAAVQSRKGSAE
jgi:hypothetical protein